MSQLGFGTTNKQLVTVKTDDFGVITVSAGTLSSFKIGERITGGTSGATARVSGVISATELRVKAIKPKSDTGALFTTETITGETSTATATVSAFSVSRKELRYNTLAPTISTGNVTFATTGSHLTWATASSTTNNGMAPGSQILVSGAVASSGANNQLYTVLTVVDGTHLTVTPTPATAEGPVAVTTKAIRQLMTFDTITADDMGLKRTARDGLKEVVNATRAMLSKSQNTDTSVAPTLTYTLPAAKTYADGDVLQFKINSTESLSVSGAPRIAILNAVPGATTYALYVPAKSTAMELVFEYANNAAASDAGQIQSVTYNANGATITDIGGGAITPTVTGSVTGIILA